MNRIFVSMLSITMLLSASQIHAQQAPPNDNFANRLPLTGSSFNFSGTTYGATFEDNDPARPNFYPLIQGTVWWSWTPATDGYALLTAPDVAALWEYHVNDDGPQLAVFAADSLQGLDWNSKIALLYASPERYVPFRFFGGKTYSFELFSYSVTNETIGFHLESSATPIILQQPQSQLVRLGGATIFTVWCPDYGTNSNIQWQHNGVNIPGAVSPSLLLTNISASAAGEYRALVNTRDPQHITASQAATLTVFGADVQPTVYLNCIPGDANNVWVLVSGERNQYYTLHYSTNFEFKSTLLFPGYSPQFIPYVANGTYVPFSPRIDSGHWFIRARRAGDLRQTCSAMLRRIEFAKEVWKAASNQVTGSAIFQAGVDEYIDGYKENFYPQCPLGGFLTYYQLGQPAYCEIHGPAQ